MLTDVSKLRHLFLIQAYYINEEQNKYSLLPFYIIDNSLV